MSHWPKAHGAPSTRLAYLTCLLLSTLAACERAPLDMEVDASGPQPLEDASPQTADAGPPNMDGAALHDGTSQADGAPPDATLHDAAAMADAAQDVIRQMDATQPDSAPPSMARPMEPRDAAAEEAGAQADSAALPPFDASTEPLRAPDRVWTYIEFPDTRCRDGSAAGISLSLRKPSTKLVIYLEGGVYCFDGPTCLINPSKVEDLLFNSAKRAPSEGIFDRENPQNPLRDWNIVYVPYCSGDGHGGTKTQPTDVPDGPKQQYFSGQLNLAQFLRRVVPTFPDVTDVLLTGMSAGGFGVLQNMFLVQRAFPQLRVRYINDSGPPLSTGAIPSCMQAKLRTLWGLGEGSLAACGGSCPDPNDYLQDNALFLAQRFGDRPSGFIDAIEDEPQRMLLGIGLRDCKGTFLLDTLPAQPYRDALLAYRDKLKAFPAAGTFIPQGTQHTWIRMNSFYTGSAQGTKLVDWFARIANGHPAGHVGP